MNGFEHPLLGTGLGTFGGSAAQKYGYFAYTSMDSVYINVLQKQVFRHYYFYLVGVVIIF